MVPWLTSLDFRKSKTGFSPKGMTTTASACSDRQKASTCGPVGGFGMMINLERWSVDAGSLQTMGSPHCPASH